MPVVERIDWISRQLQAGRRCHMSLGGALDPSKIKAKITIESLGAGAISRSLLMSMRSHLAVLRCMAANNVAVDRGHYHQSSGRSVISIWISLRPDNQRAHAANNDDDNDGDDDHGGRPHKNQKQYDRRRGRSPGAGNPGSDPWQSPDHDPWHSSGGPSQPKQPRHGKRATWVRKCTSVTPDPPAIDDRGAHNTGRRTISLESSWNADAPVFVPNKSILVSSGVDPVLHGDDVYSSTQHLLSAQSNTIMTLCTRINQETPKLERLCLQMEGLKQLVSCHPSLHGRRSEPDLNKRSVQADLNNVDRLDGPSLSNPNDHALVLSLKHQVAASLARNARKDALRENGRLLQSLHVPAGALSSDFAIDELFIQFAGGSTNASLKEPYIVSSWQVENLCCLCQALAGKTAVRTLHVETHFRSKTSTQALDELARNMLASDLCVSTDFVAELHLRELSFDNGIVIASDRGLDLYRRTDRDGLKRCKMTQINYYETLISRPSDLVNGTGMSTYASKCQGPETLASIVPKHLNAQSGISMYLASLPKATGIVKRILATRHFGFIAIGTQTGIVDLFFNTQQITDSVEQGDLVVVSIDFHADRPKAVCVSRLSGDGIARIQRWWKLRMRCTRIAVTFMKFSECLLKNQASIAVKEYKQASSRNLFCWIIVMRLVFVRMMSSRPVSRSRLTPMSAGSCMMVDTSRSSNYGDENPIPTQPIYSNAYNADLVTETCGNGAEVEEASCDVATNGVLTSRVNGSANDNNWRLTLPTSTATTITLTVDELLGMPFDEAICALPGLRTHIDARQDQKNFQIRIGLRPDDGLTLDEIYRGDWHADAPAGLRQEIDQLITNAVFNEEVMEEIASCSFETRSR